MVTLEENITSKVNMHPQVDIFFPIKVICQPMSFS